MWIQVRTIDGTETQTIDDLSRLTKIECLREKIQETFRVSPDRQRLFYRGKQVRRSRPPPAGGSLCGRGPGPRALPRLLFAPVPPGLQAGARPDRTPRGAPRVGVAPVIFIF